MFKLSKHGKDKIKNMKLGIFPSIKKFELTEIYVKLLAEEPLSKNFLKQFNIDIDELSKLSIPYFRNTLDFDLAFFISCLSGLFKLSDHTDPVKTMIKVNRYLEKMNQDSLLDFLDWLNEKPDFVDVNPTLIRYQILDTLLQYKIKDINYQKVGKNQKYLVLEYNLLIDEHLTRNFNYCHNNLRICSNKLYIFEVSLEILDIRPKVLEEVIKTLKHNKKNNITYLNLDDLYNYTYNQAKTKCKHLDPTYLICSSNNKTFNKYLKEIEKNIKPYLYRLNETLELIENNILPNIQSEDKNTTYINLDTFRRTKSCTNRNYVSHDYLISSDDLEKYEFYVQKIQKIGIKKSGINKENKKTNVKKMKRLNINPNVKQTVWANHNGDTFEGTCFCCDMSLEWRNHDCGHIIADSMGGLPIEENLRPVCRKCNLHMGNENMYDYMRRNHMAGLKNIN